MSIKFIKSVFLLASICFYSIISIAASSTPFLTITPTSIPALPEHSIVGTEIPVTYIVKNTSPVASSISLKSENVPVGVSQVNGDNPCSLNTIVPVGGSCLLHFSVDTTAIGVGNSINYAPKVCLQGNPYYCAVPSSGQQMSTQVIPKPKPTYATLALNPDYVELSPGNTADVSVINTSKTVVATGIKETLPAELVPYVSIDNSDCVAPLNPQQFCTLHLNTAANAPGISNPVIITIAGDNTYTAELQATIVQSGIEANVLSDEFLRHVQYKAVKITNVGSSPATYLGTSISDNAKSWLHICHAGDDTCHGYNPTDPKKKVCVMGQILTPSDYCAIWVKALPNNDLGDQTGKITINTNKNSPNLTVNYKMAIYAGGYDANTSEGNVWVWDGGSLNALLTKGFNNPVRALANYEGDLYIGGDFTALGSTTYHYISRFNGDSIVYPNLIFTYGTNGPIKSFTVYKDKLYLGGAFTQAANISANYIASWDNTNQTWAPLGNGFSGTGSVQVNQLATDGTYLYAAGSFTNAGSGAAANIARWDGNAWVPLGEGTTDTVNALSTAASGLYVGGNFEHAGVVITSVKHVGLWSNGDWSILGSGMQNGTQGNVYALHSMNNKLYVGGNFTQVQGGAVNANYISAWDPMSQQWSSVGDGLENGVNGPVYSIFGWNNEIFVGGNFTQAGGVTSNGLARWNGYKWDDLFFIDTDHEIVINSIVGMPSITSIE